MPLRLLLILALASASLSAGTGAVAAKGAVQSKGDLGLDGASLDA